MSARPQSSRQVAWASDWRLQNLIAMRFSNIFFEPIWNRNYVSSVQITFKENFGTQGAVRASSSALQKRRSTLHWPATSWSCVQGEAGTLTSSASSVT